jgi:hypothetical protein
MDGVVPMTVLARVRRRLAVTAAAAALLTGASTLIAGAPAAFASTDGGCYSRPTNLTWWLESCISSHPDGTVAPDAWVNWTGDFLGNCTLYVKLRDDTWRTTVAWRSFDCTNDERVGGISHYYAGEIWPCSAGHDYHTYVFYVITFPNGQVWYREFNTDSPELHC